MFRAGLTLLRRFVCAALLLVLLACGVEVGVRAYEVATGHRLCSLSDVACGDPSRLSIPSESCYQELKVLAKAKVDCQDTKTDVEIRTNSKGLRGPEPLDPKPDDVYRIVVLGDETIYAPETAEADHFCTLLQRKLQELTRLRIEVVNAGIPGHCPLTEYLLFKQRLRILQPDLVLLHFDWSDVSDDRQLRRFTRCDDSRVVQACPHPKLAVTKKFRACAEWRQQFRLLDLAMSKMSNGWKYQMAQQRSVSRENDSNPYSWLRNESPEDDVAFRQARQPIADLAQLCRASYASLVLMTSPKPWQVSAKCCSGRGVRLSAGVTREAYYSNRAPFDVLARYAQRENVPFIDASTVLAEGPNPEANYLRYAPRWSREGHQLVSELVAGFLIDNVPGAWNSPYFRQSEQPLKTQSPEERTIEWMSGEAPQQNEPIEKYPRR